MKFIKFIISRICISAFLLYGYNLISINYNLMIPINFITVFIISIFDTLGLVFLVLFRLLL